MQSIRRSCQSALRGLEKQSIPTNVSRRTLSSTYARRRGALPVYLPPSNVELETLLADLNSKVLLTAQLNRVQQKLVYKKENIAKLDNEPIEVTLGDVSLPLVHIDRVRDIPARWKQLREIVSRSVTNEDWENVIRVMEGFERAGISLREERREMIVRKLNENGMQHLVLKSLQRASATGLRLRDFLVLRQVVKGVHDKAATAGWAEKETQKALSFAEQIVELMEDVEHCGKSKPEFDFRTKPMVVALPVEMAATIAKNHGGNTEKTFKYAKRLMNTLKQNEFLAADLSEVARLTNTLRPETFQSAHSQMTTLTNFSFKIWELVPVWNALNTSRRVLDTAMPMAVEALKLETKIADVLEKSSETAQLLRYRDGKQLCSEKHIASSIAEAVKRKQ